MDRSLGSNLLHHLLRPARGGAAGVVIIFTLLLILSSHAGWLGLPLALILFSWYFKYCFILFDHVVRGFDDPPALDIQKVNPLSDLRPWAQLLILVCAVGLIRLIAVRALPLAWALGLAVAALLPATVAILALDKNPFKAVYPPALKDMLGALGSGYWTALAVILGLSGLLALSVSVGLWAPVQIALSLFAYLSMYSILGGAVYDRRHELGLETWASPERTAEQVLAAERKARDAVVTQAYGELRARKPAAAWATLEAWVKARGGSPDEYRALRDAVAAWPDPRYASRLTEDYVQALLAAKRAGDALDAVRERLRAAPDFRPKTAAATLEVARLAGQGGGAPAVARTLLADFATRFPGDPLIDEARALAHHLSA